MFVQDMTGGLLNVERIMYIGIVPETGRQSAVNAKTRTGEIIRLYVGKKADCQKVMDGLAYFVKALDVMLLVAEPDTAPDFKTLPNENSLNKPIKYVRDEDDMIWAKPRK